jgi:hypothetical protein
VSRDEKDCDVLKGISGLTNTVKCECSGSGRLGVTIFCGPMKEKLCITPSDDLFCTKNPNETASFDTLYRIDSTARKRLSSSPPVKIRRESVFGAFAELEEPRFRNIFQFSFNRGDGSSSSKTYTSCAVTSEPDLFVFDDCNSCDICDSGVDFKYDCSNTKGAYIYNNVTNTTELIPGPKVETCFPVADVLPSF